MSNDTKKIPAADAENYFKEASEWDLDQVQRSKQSEKRAWRVATIAGTIAFMSVSANFMLFPLKEVQSQVIRVDSVTGMVDVQRVLKDAPAQYNEETDKYWLRLYVRSREGWLFDEFNYIYRSVGLLSSAQEQRRWFDFYRPENPSSPYNQFSNRVKVKVKIRSVTFIDKNVANVRFTKIQENITGGAPIETYWIATMKYRYVNTPIAETEREINPLGFQVTEWRVDPETGVITGGQQ